MPLLVLLIVLVAAPVAFADPADDYRAVHRDWEEGGTVTPCRWSVGQLENAREIADGNPDDTYNGFPERVDEEIARWRSGGCEPRPRIAGVAAKRERVRIVNRGGRAAKVGGMRLRDRQGNTIKLRRGLRIAPGESIVVRSGRRPIWDDKGDIARLVAGNGTVVSQYGYGRFRQRKRF
jgi:hypothetical protein